MLISALALDVAKAAGLLLTLSALVMLSLFKSFTFEINISNTACIGDDVLVGVIVSGCDIVSFGMDWGGAVLDVGCSGAIAGIDFFPS